MTGLALFAAAPAAAQTRLPTGAPGPAYWQQRVDYDVDARLDPAAHRLEGTARVIYRNRSPDTLRTLHWHLYQNIFRAGAPGRRAAQVVGRAMTTTRGITVHEVTANGAPLTRQERGTLMETPLPTPLAPGGELTLDVRWELDVPRIASLRTGSVDEDFGMAQWYPQIAVYDDVHGWNTTPYRGQGEFYLEYGDWNVRLTLPRRFLVAATGTLQNPAEVLTPAQRARLAGVRAGRVTAVVTDADTGGVGVDGDTRTWHFGARNVRDFAWAASPRFVWNSTRTLATARHPDGVLIHSFFPPGLRAFYGRSADVARDAIEFFDARFGAYVYPQATVVSGPVEGMEYPMLVFEGVESRVINMPPQVTVHELAHEWYPMMIGSNETRHPFMDEGFATYITSLALARRYAGGGLWSERLPRFARGLLGRGDERRFNARLALVTAGRPGDMPLMAHADSIPELQLATNVYNKASGVLFMLRDVVGEDTLARAMRAYYDRWLMKHPYPGDFFNTVEDVAGRDLDWFWNQWFYQTWTLDLAVTQVRESTEGGRIAAAVTLANEGRAIMPATVRLTLTDGSTRDVRVPEAVWRGASRHTLRVDSLPARVRSVEVDPGLALLDADRADNVWPRNAPTAAGPFFGVTAAELAAMLAFALVATIGARVAGALAGLRRAGMRPARFGARRLVLWTRARGLRPGWRRRAMLFGPTTLGVPPTFATPDDLRRRTARAFAGGPAAAAVLAALAALGCVALELAYRRGLRGDTDYTIDALIFLVGAVSLAGLGVSLLPRFPRGFFPAHPWVRLLVSDEPNEVRWSAAQALVAASHDGTRPREWSPELVPWATAPADGSRADAGASLLAYYQALDRGETASADGWLTRAEAATGGWWRRRLRRVVAAERAYHVALVVGNVDRARAALRRMGRGRGVPRHLRLRARTAVAAAAGDTREVERLLARGRTGLGRVASEAGPGMAALEGDLLMAIERRPGEATEPVETQGTSV